MKSLNLRRCALRALSAGLVLRVCSSLSSAAIFMPLGDLPGGEVSSEAYALSADGRVVAGHSSSANGTEAFRWTAADGMQGLGDLPDGTFSSFGYGISHDGSTIVGTSRSGEEDQAFRQVAAGPLMGLGDMLGGAGYSIAYAASADGSVIVGRGNDPAGGRGFRWTQASGMVSLGVLPSTSFSEASGVSADGMIIVGTSGSAGFRWTSATGMTNIGDLPGGFTSTAVYSISADGSTIVGRSSSSNGFEAFRHVGGVMSGIGDLPGGVYFSSAIAASADGTVIVGSGDGAAGAEAFIWDTTHGMRALKQLLMANGATGLTGWTLREARAVSADGTFVAGLGTNPSGRPEGWVAWVPIPEPGAGGATSTVLLVLAARRSRALRRGKLLRHEGDGPAAVLAVR